MVGIYVLNMSQDPGGVRAHSLRKPILYASWEVSKGSRAPFPDMPYQAVISMEHQQELSTAHRPSYHCYSFYDRVVRFYNL